MNELATPGTSRIPKPDKDQKSLKVFTHTLLHDYLEMTGTHPLFDISGSYVEIDGWVSLHFSKHATLFGSTVSRIKICSNPETGSIHEYEDYDLSAESFLDQLNTMEMLPSMRMHISSTSIRADSESNVTTSLYGLNNESESPDVEDSLRREGSESPETDVDFRHSSSEGTDIDRVLRTESVGLKASDKAFIVEAKRVENVPGEIRDELIVQNEETVIGSKAVTREEPEKAILDTPILVFMEYAKEISKH